MHDDDEEEEAEAAGGCYGRIRDEVVFHVSLKAEAIDEILYLNSLIKPIFRSYYDIIGFLDTFKMGDHVKISQLLQQTKYTKDRVNRVIRRLVSMEALTIVSDTQENCVQLTVPSLCKLQSEVLNYVL